MSTNEDREKSTMQYAQNADRKSERNGRRAEWLGRNKEGPHSHMLTAMLTAQLQTMEPVRLKDKLPPCTRRDLAVLSCLVY